MTMDRPRGFPLMADFKTAGGLHVWNIVRVVYLLGVFFGLAPYFSSVALMA